MHSADITWSAASQDIDTADCSLQTGMIMELSSYINNTRRGRGRGVYSYAMHFELISCYPRKHGILERNLNVQCLIILVFPFLIRLILLTIIY